MTTMVERMARAMEPELFALEDRARATGDPLALVCFAWQHAEAVNAARAKALAALREMREPTEVMLRAVDDVGYTHPDDGTFQRLPPDEIIAMFAAAIDAEIAAYEGKK